MLIARADSCDRQGGCEHYLTENPCHHSPLIALEPVLAHIAVWRSRPASTMLPGEALFEIVLALHVRYEEGENCSHDQTYDDAHWKRPKLSRHNPHYHSGNDAF